MRTKLAIAVTVAALGLGVTAFAPAVRAGSRPISGSAEGNITFFEPPILRADVAGTATHLGPFTRTETLTLTGGPNFTGIMTFIASNGDELDADFAGHFTDADHVVGTYTFTPTGTGRFDDATGTADFAASKDEFGHVWVSFEGEIDY